MLKVGQIVTGFPGTDYEFLTGEIQVIQGNDVCILVESHEFNPDLIGEEMWCIGTELAYTEDSVNFTGASTSVDSSYAFNYDPPKADLNIALVLGLL